MSARVAVVGGIALGAGLLAWALPGAMSVPDPVPAGWPYAASSPAACQEDEPCWDCETMGNRTCGDGARPAQPDAYPLEASTNAPAWMLETDGLDDRAAGDLALAYEYVSQMGGTWRRIGSAEADALAEGTTPGAETRAWEACRAADTPNDEGLAFYQVACPDGYVYVEPRGQ